jgi:predicted regulator of Ras-like GTPase activity (Roadblock/LC7/MglB family)
VSHAHTESIQEILQELHRRIDGLEAIAIIRQDGTVLAQLHSGLKHSNIEAIFTEFAALTREVCQALQQGAHTEAMIKTQNRFLALYSTKGANIVLGIIGQATINFGLLNSGCRIAIEKLEQLFSD